MGSAGGVEGVRDLVARYCDAVTRFDIDAWAACWDAAAVWVVPGTGELRGRPEIVEWFTRTRATYDLCIQELLSGRVDVDVDGSTARARWYVRELQHSLDGSGGELVGVYDDAMACGFDDRWCFTRRGFHLLYRGRRELPGRVYRTAPPPAF